MGDIDADIAYLAAAIVELIGADLHQSRSGFTRIALRLSAAAALSFESGFAVAGSHGDSGKLSIKSRL